MAYRGFEILGGMSRRAFLRRSGLLAAGLALPSSIWTGCGDDGESTPPPELVVDPNTPWWLQGNYAPVFDERVDFDLPVRGRIPAGLNGTYLRNGSNPQKSDSPHWFFGDGMLHSVRIENGRAVAYRNRYIRTPLYEQGISFGTGAPPLRGNNQSNVSVVYHAGKLLTSGEVGFPFQIDPADLSTVGVYSFDEKIETSFTAHPKIDPVTGHLHFFGYWFVPPFLTYHVADRTGRVVHTQVIPVEKSSMMHSFAITDRDVIFWECPVLFDLEAALNGATNPFSWTPEYGTRVGIMPLGGSAEEIRWVEIENCYVFHEVNAFRDGSEVVIDLCRHATMFDGNDLGQSDLTIRRWRIDTAGANLSFREEVVSDRQLELPSHDRRFSGRPHRYGWFADTNYHPLTVDFTGTGMIDYRSGRVHTWNPGPTRHAGEVFFVPGGAAEGEGWLFTFAYDHATDTSDLVILDALHVEDGPVAEIRMPRRVPYGFHGNWIPA